METGTPVTARIRIDAQRDLNVRGKVLKTRKMFGRNEILIDVTDADPLWVTQERVKQN